VLAVEEVRVQFQLLVEAVDQAVEEEKEQEVQQVLVIHLQ
jgi:hypothetical protein